ncbi:hypothetical protein AOLI_G00292250 [Acnodon oligacanthus]
MKKRCRGHKNEAKETGAPGAANSKEQFHAGSGKNEKICIHKTHAKSYSNTKIITVELPVDVRYSSPRDETNMAVISVKLLSGFKLDEESLRPLSSESTLKRGPRGRKCHHLFGGGEQLLEDHKLHSIWYLEEQ